MDLSRLLNNPETPYIFPPTPPTSQVTVISTPAISVPPAPAPQHQNSHTLSNPETRPPNSPHNRTPFASISTNIPSIPSSYQLGTSWADRNPTHATQPKVSHPAPKATAASKAARKERSKENRANKEAFAEDVAALREGLEEDISHLASKFNKSVKDVRKIVLQTVSKGPKKKLSDANVLVKWRSHQDKINNKPPINAVLERLPIVLEDISNGDISETELKLARQYAEDNEELKAVGMRASNKSAQTDAQHVAQTIGSMLLNLYHRTGVVSLVFMSKSHVLDPFTSTVLEVRGSSQFIMDVLGRDPTECLLLFEQFNCVRENLLLPPLKETTTVKEKQSQAADQISALLCKATKKDKVKMNYEKFDSKIKHNHGVQIVGWPDNVPFRRPSTITNHACLNLLLDALKSRQLRFVPMSAEDILAMSKTITKKTAKKTTAVTSTKKRQRRNRSEDEESSEGDEDDEEMEGGQDSEASGSDEEDDSPHKRRRISAPRRVPQPRSRSYLTNTDDDED